MNRPDMNRPDINRPKINRPETNRPESNRPEIRQSHEPTPYPQSAALGQLPTMHPLLLGGLVFAFVGLAFDLRHELPTAPSNSHHEACQGSVKEQVTLSRTQLAQFLTISERDSRDKVTQIVGAPYCELQSLQVRASVTAERQVYPLAFDPHTRLVILYEGQEYAGFRFSFQ